MDASVARLKELEGKLETIVKRDFAHKNDGHEPGHPARVCKMAMHLQTREGGDIVVLTIAAYLHDYHRVAGDTHNCACQPDESLDKVKKIVAELDLGLSALQVQKVLDCVNYHNLGPKSTPKGARCIEVAVIQDADTLDDSGATGIIRNLRYSGAHSVPLEKEIEHIFRDNVRAIGIGHKLNTATAKTIAEKRLTFMVDFFRRYAEEERGAL